MSPCLKHEMMDAEDERDILNERAANTNALTVNTSACSYAPVVYDPVSPHTLTCECTRCASVRAATFGTPVWQGLLVSMTPEAAPPKKGEPTTFEEAVGLVLEDMATIMLDRQRKYGPTNIQRGGIHGLLVRIGDKLARLEEDHKACPFKGECLQRDLPDEKVEDAWLDLANYAGPIGIMLQRGWWGLPLEGVDESN